MQHGSYSPMKDSIFTQPYPSIIVLEAENITPIASHSKRTNKRDFPDAMDTGEEESAKNPKKQNIEEVGQIVEKPKARKNRSKSKDHPLNSMNMPSQRHPRILPLNSKPWLSYLINTGRIKKYQRTNPLSCMQMSGKFPTRNWLQLLLDIMFRTL